MSRLFKTVDVIMASMLLIAVSFVSVWLYVEFEHEREEEPPPETNFLCRNPALGKRAGCQTVSIR